MKHSVPAIQVVLLIIFSTACSQVTSPAIPSPAATSAPTPSPVPITSTPVSLPTVPPGLLMEEVGVGFGGGGGVYSDYPCFEWYLPPTGTTLPVIESSMGRGNSDLGQGDLVDLCVFGLPQNEEFNLSLTDPKGALISQGKVYFEEDEYKSKILYIPDGVVESELLGYAYIKNEISIMEFQFWWPLGLVDGSWRIGFSNEKIEYEGMFEIPDRYGVSIRPDHADPFSVSKSCSWWAAKAKGADIRYKNQIKTGQIAYISGRGYEPNAKVPIGLYFQNEQDFQDRKWTLTHSLMVQVDAQGNFDAEIYLDDTYESGAYLPGYPPPKDDISQYTSIDYSSCFSIP